MFARSAEICLVNGIQHRTASSIVVGNSWSCLDDFASTAPLSFAVTATGGTSVSDRAGDGVECLATIADSSVAAITGSASMSATRGAFLPAVLLAHMHMRFVGSVHHEDA